ncbi:MAG: redoxin domain-containing protein [Nitrospirae bacterium]|nr:redoxin domain-containing protein [Nitrospirota bacterium]MBI5696454.1 redoxin domain-containing protein [Nitrospirota bacterium]
MRFSVVLKALVLLYMVSAVAVPLCSANAFRNLEEGGQAPDFTLKDTQGNDVTLSGYTGKVVVALFFRPDQEKSHDAMADLQKVHAKYASKGVVVLGIMPEPGQKAKLAEEMEHEKVTYTVLLDDGKAAYGGWGVFLYPTTGILGKDGRLFRHIPSHNRKYADTVEGNVRLALGEINEGQLNELLNPKEIERLSPEQKKAERHMMLGQRMVERKLLDRAAHEYEQAVEADPSLAAARVAYGFVLLKMGDPAKAKEHFAKAVEQDPKVDDGKTGLGAAEVAAGELDKGIATLEDALKLNTKPARAHFELGKAYEKKGAADKASENYRKAAEELGGAAW